MADNLNGKVAIVTGGARDIGRAISLKFAAMGANVVVNYNESSKEAEKTLQNLKAIGARAIAVQADVSNAEDVSKSTCMRWNVDREIVPDCKRPVRYNRKQHPGSSRDREKAQKSKFDEIRIVRIIQNYYKHSKEA